MSQSWPVVSKTILKFPLLSIKCYIHSLAALYLDSLEKISASCTKLFSNGQEVFDKNSFKSFLLVPRAIIILHRIDFLTTSKENLYTFYYTTDYIIFGGKIRDGKQYSSFLCCFFCFCFIVVFLEKNDVYILYIKVCQN